MPREKSLAARVVADLEARNVTATPQAFEVWHSFLSGTDAALTATVNALIEVGALNDDALAEVHEQHCRDGSNVRVIESSSRSILMEIEGVSALVKLNLGSSSRYREVLGAMLGDLGSMGDPGGLQEAIGTLVRATDDARAANVQMEERLRAAQNELEQLRETIKTVRQETLVDALTGVANRRHFDQAVRQACEALEAGGPSVCLLMIDVDHFKQFNDRHGHQIGDKVLKIVAQTLRDRFRDRAIVARYGGEEFAVIIPRCDLASGWSHAEVARQAIHARELVKRSTGEKLGRITVSVGVGLARKGEASRNLVARADTALRQAKQRGRNRTVTEEQIEESNAA